MLNFGTGSQATHYFILCVASILGMIQLVAARSNRRDLLWLDARPSFVLGAIMIPASFVWFFLTDEEIFIPGLAGGELIAIFFAAFVTAVPTTRGIAALTARARSSVVVPHKSKRAFMTVNSGRKRHSTILKIFLPRSK